MKILDSSFPFVGKINKMPRKRKKRTTRSKYKVDDGLILKKI